MSPSTIVTPAKPEAIPVANGLIVEPSTPIPAPRRMRAAAVSRSYPAATMTVMISA